MRNDRLCESSFFYAFTLMCMLSLSSGSLANDIGARPYQLMSNGLIRHLVPIEAASTHNRGPGVTGYHPCVTYVSVNGKNPVPMLVQHNLGIRTGTITLDRAPDFNEDINIEWGSINDSIRVNAGGDILNHCKMAGSITFSSIIKSQWVTYLDSKEVKRDRFWYDCLVLAAVSKKLTIYNPNLPNEKVFTSPAHPLMLKGDGICKNIQAQSVNSDKNIRCEVDGRQTLCDTNYFRRVDGKISVLSFAEAVAAQMSDIPVEIGQFENAEGKAQTQRANIVAQKRADDEARAMAEKKQAENKKIEDEKRRVEEEKRLSAWRDSPEGKKHLAEEDAKRRKIEEDRNRAELQEQARLAKLGPPKFKVFKSREWVEGWGRFVNYVVFQSTDGDVSVSKVNLNRGNCFFNYIMLDRRGAVSLPHRLNFGESLKIETRECQLIEASIETNRGNLTFQFN